MNIEQFNPKHHPRYSKNLYNWLRRRQREHPSFSVERVLAPVYRDPSGTLWIGHLDKECTASTVKTWFHGCKLMSIFCNGASQKEWAYSVGFHMKALQLVPDFWDQYLADGRCAIDRKHQMSFIGDKSRWKVDGLIRDCLWCGKHRQELVQWEEVVRKEEWKPAKGLPAQPPIED